MLNICRTIDHENVRISLEGRLDAASAPALERELMGSLDGATSVTLDLEKLDFISSAGLRVLLAAQKIMNLQGEMKVVRVGEAVMKVFELSGFSNILTIE